MNERWRLRTVLVTVVAMSAVAVAAWQVWRWRDARAEGERERAAVHLASAQVIDLTTIDAATVTKKLDAMAARTTGEFTRQLEGIQQTFVRTVTGAALSAKGRIDAAAIAKVDEHAATVLVASSATVMNKAEPQPATRSYRMAVHLRWVGGRWRIDGMEFVP